MINTQKSNGFTLIEIMITVAILAIVVALALPTYQNYVNKARRVEATNLLQKIAAEQEKFYFENNSYFDDTTLKGFAWIDPALLTENGYYSVSTRSTNLLADFIVTATPVAGGVQAGDKNCTTITINQNNQRDATGKDPDSCWK